MARKNTIQVLRTTRAALNSQAGVNGLRQGEPYLITDEGRMALGLSASTYEVFLKATEGVPPGSIMAYSSTTAPDGWVNANGRTIGSAVSGATMRPHADTFALYSLLFGVTRAYTKGTVTETSFGTSAQADWDAGKHYAVHDLRAQFVRGLDESRGLDPSRVLGSAQLDALKSHDHVYYVSTSTTANYSVAAAQSSNTRSAAIRTELEGGDETRPRNVALPYIIKL